MGIPLQTDELPIAAVPLLLTTGPLTTHHSENVNELILGLKNACVSIWC